MNIKFKKILQGCKRKARLKWLLAARTEELKRRKNTRPEVKEFFSSFLKKELFFSADEMEVKSGRAKVVRDLDRLSGIYYICFDNNKEFNLNDAESTFFWDARLKALQDKQKREKSNEKEALEELKNYK